MQAIAILGLLANDIENRIDELGALSVMAFRPIVSGAGLPKDEVIRPEDLSKRPRSDGIHGPGLQIHEDSAWDVPPATRLVVVDIDALELELGVAAVLPGVVNSVLVANDFPELGSDLVPALASLDVENFSHLVSSFGLFVSRESAGV